jgi:PleD family two-component response regulator
MKVILVVDDDATNLRTLGELLRPEYRVRLASSGEDALRIAGSDPRPDLILLDVMMPVMDGYEVLRRLQADEATRAIPVVFVTALHDEDSEQRGFELGAADFIHKPIRAAVALSRIRAQIDARTARESLRRKAQHMARVAEQGAEQLENTRQQLLQSEKWPPSASCRRASPTRSTTRSALWPPTWRRSGATLTISSPSSTPAPPNPAPRRSSASPKCEA